MSILAWIVVGLVAGFLANLVMRGRGFGLIGDLVLGVVGAIVGALLASALLGIQDPLSGIDIGTILIAFVGAVIVIAIARAVVGRR